MKAIAVVDVNLLVRGVLSAKGGSRVLLIALKQNRFRIITSRQHLFEIYRVLGYPRLARKWPIARRIRKRLIAQIYRRAIWVDFAESLRLCRDPKDDYLLQMALLGQATHLISEDNDLHQDPIIPIFLSQRGIQLVHLGDFLRTISVNA
jgi:putative PIN family toxin of toxin-antitoxin system